MKASHDTNQFLLHLCDDVFRAQKQAEEEHRRELYGDGPYIGLVLYRQDKVKVELRKEKVNHNEPHIHIMHSDKINVSVSLKDFRILAGKIDKRTYKKLLAILVPVRSELNEIWLTLNDRDNAVSAEKLKHNLFNE